MHLKYPASIRLYPYQTQQNRNRTANNSSSSLFMISNIAALPLHFFRAKAAAQNKTATKNAGCLSFM